MKKILSLILALSLIISVAPMSFAIKSTETEPAVDATFREIPGMHFNFSAANWGDPSADVDLATIDKNDTESVPKYATTNTDPWRLTGQCGIADYRITSDTPAEEYGNSKANALYWEFRKAYSTLSSNAPQAGLVLAVYFNETGVFIPSITYEAGPNSCVQSIFIGPRDISATRTNKQYYFYRSTTERGAGDLKFYQNEPMKSAFKATRNPELIMIGQPNFYTSTETPEKETDDDFDPITIEKEGFYYLYLVPSRSNKTTPEIDNYYMNLYSIDFEPAPANVIADMAFTATEDTSNPPVNSASIAAYTVCGTESPVRLADAPTGTYGETCELDAPETKTGEDGKTYNFLYWARGLESSSNRKIVSTKNKFDYRPHEGTNYLIAVYEDADASKVEFYNGNGELMTDLALDEGNLPEVPYMAGHDESTGWKRQGDDTVYEAGEAAPTDGSMVFVAQYNDPEADITISINGVSDTYAYGDTVTCESDDANFSYWEKTINGKNQIVSIDKKYTFNAWEACSVTAVCNGAFDLGRAARKILLGTFTVGNQTAVMAEFVGFGNAFEKGIVVDGNEIAMQSENNQFTITNDTTSAVTVTGYAILDEAGVTTRYKDGSITVAGVPAAE